MRYEDRTVINITEKQLVYPRELTNQKCFFDVKSLRLNFVCSHIVMPMGIKIGFDCDLINRHFVGEPCETVNRKQNKKIEDI